MVSAPRKWSVATDEGTVDFRRLAVRLVGQRLNAAMEMAAEGARRACA